MAKAGPLLLLSLASLEGKFQWAVRNQRSREPKKECEKIRSTEIRNVKLKSTRTRKHNSAKIQKRENKKAQNTKLENNKIQQRKNSKARSVENTETWKQQSSKGRKHETFTKTWNTKASKHKGTKTWKRGNAKELNLESRRTRILENAKRRKHENRETQNLEKREIATHEHTYRFKRRVHTLRFLFFFYKTPRWENCLPYNQSAGRWRPAVWFVRKAIYKCDPVCARSESLCRHFFHFWCFSLSQFFTFSRVHWLTFLFLTFSFVYFSLPHWLTFLFLTFQVVHFPLPHLLTFSLSRFRSYQQTVGNELSADFGTQQTLKLLLKSRKGSVPKFCMFTNLITSWHWLEI